MVKRSKGFLSKKTRKLKRRKKFTVTDFVKSFSLGQKVIISVKPYFSGLPNPRYNNRSGVIVEKRGESYVVEILDGNLKKGIVSHPIHLKHVS
ncbi:50S ribosomal protein L21e [Candidatus Micrarchaeota archaeon]|nr:50S ribosomal protein L21e [Candidatus Micrarchaeota archaeon]